MSALTKSSQGAPSVYTLDSNFSQRMQPLVTEAFKNLNQRVEHVEWFPAPEKGKVDETRYLDKILHQDGQFILRPFLDKAHIKLVSTFQSKTRRHKYSDYADLTLETLSNKFGTEGEFFNLTAQYYLYSYADKTETAITRMWVLDTNRLNHFIVENYDEVMRSLKQNRYHSSACFVTIPFDRLDKAGVVVFSSDRVKASAKDLPTHTLKDPRSRTVLASPRLDR